MATSPENASHAQAEELLATIEDITSARGELDMTHHSFNKVIPRPPDEIAAHFTEVEPDSKHIGYLIWLGRRLNERLRIGSPVGTASFRQVEFRDRDLA